MERRDFIKNCTVLCAGGIGLSLLMESCGGVHYAASTAEAERIRISKTEFTDPKKGERKFVVVRNEKLQFPVCIYKKGSEYSAIYMQCTHQGCELNPNAS